MEVLKDKKIIDRILNKATEEVLPSKGELEALLLSGKKIKVYQGFDPTAPTLHIGHIVSMRKLEDFRQLGHEVYFLIGDFTARIGDPTDKTSSRQKLSREQVLENLKVYTQQASKIIDIENKENPIKVVFNHDWLSKLTFEEIIELASHFTVQQMIKRDMFQKRLEENKPIYLSEFLYPLMQGYDSVNLEVDVELCGNDQMFNALAGRHLSQELLKKDKFVLTGKLLTTADGKKMGKSEGNMIKLTDSPQDMYGKVMSFPDEQIIPGFELLTDTDLEEVERLKEQIETTNPMELKKKLAFMITEELHSTEEAQKAQLYFESIFQNKDFNTEIQEVIVSKESSDILTLIVEDSKLLESKSQARRLIEQSAVSIDGEKVTDSKLTVNLNKEITLKVGKQIIKIVK